MVYKFKQNEKYSQVSFIDWHDLWGGAVEAQTYIFGSNWSCEDDEREYHINSNSSDWPTCNPKSCTDKFGIVHTGRKEIEWVITNGIEMASVQHPNDPEWVRVKWQGCPPNSGTVTAKVKCIDKELNELDQENTFCADNVSFVESKNLNVRIYCTGDLYSTVPSTISIPCCPDPTASTNTLFIFDVPTHSTGILFNNNSEVIEPVDISEVEYDAFNKRTLWNYTFPISALSLGTYTFRVTYPCSNATQNYVVTVIPEPNQLNMSPSLPNSLCWGETYNICINFPHYECMDFEYDITYIDAVGNVTVPKQTFITNNIIVNYGFCFNLTSYPNTNLGNNQKIKINFRYKPRCSNNWLTEEWFIAAPLQPPNNFVSNPSNTNIPNPFCICNSIVEITPPSWDEGTTGMDWEISNGVGYVENITTTWGSGLNTTICSNLIDINSDIQIKYRRKNPCGNSVWYTITIPASQLKDQNDPACN